MLVPVAQHQTRFTVPGLSADVRGVVSGRNAVLVLPSLDRVVGGLRVLTSEVDLEDVYGGLEVHRVRSPLGSVEFAVKFPAAGVNVLDRIARVALLYGGELLTGGDRHFVRFRDRHSPLGYDVDRLAETKGDLVVYGRVAEGAYRITETVPLRSLILRLAPEATRAADDLGEVVLILGARGLRSHAETYLWRNRVPAEVARVHLDGEQEAYLYRLRRAPVRVVNLLDRTPGFTVFVPEGERAAVERGFVHPFDLRSCTPALDPEHLYLFDGNQSGARIIEGRPDFLPLRQGVAPSVADVSLPARAAKPGPPTVIPLKLAADRTVGGRAEAVLIPHSQLGALSRLVYGLPPAALERYRAVSLERGVLIVGEESVEEIPLGLPLRRYGEATFIPLGHTFLPRLPPQLVAEALGAEAGTSYFFPSADDPPFSVRGGFRPLSRAFLASLPSTTASPTAGRRTPGRATLSYARVGAFPLWGRRYGRLRAPDEEER